MQQNQLRTSARSDQGMVHERNEDAFEVVDTEEGGRLLIVCDGMGGMGRGDEASRLAVDALKALLQPGAEPPPDERLGAAIQAADARVREELCDPAVVAQPGATAVLVYVMDGAAHVCWAGDSRAYLFRDGHMVGRTRDHKLVEDLVDSGQMTPHEAKHSSLSHVVTRALGGKPPKEDPVEPDHMPASWKLMTGDRILVCSDGLSDLVDDDELATLSRDGKIDDITQRLVDLANERGGHDNITCILAHWDGPSWDGPPPDPSTQTALRPPPDHTDELDLELTPEDDPADAKPPMAASPSPGPIPTEQEWMDRARGQWGWWSVAAALLVIALICAILALVS
ncbi:MAG: protein phosphatase 2C domain-containing protein [Myxococcales bacterium]|nr:protein phosphatase 2C domain-containing protein [Myxococcales bacterium]